MPSSQHVLPGIEAPPSPQTPRVPGELEAELLRKAAYRVGQPGAWCQHYLYKRQDGVGCWILRGPLDSIVSTCLSGAAQLEWYLGNREADYGRVHAAITEAMGTIAYSLWNDHPARTQDEVVDALLRAAEIVEVSQ